MAEQEKIVKSKDEEILAMDIFKLQKENNTIMFRIIIALAIVIAVITVGTYIHTSYITNRFLSYMELYDYSATVEQTGVYTFSDSEGNIISADISPEEMIRVLEVINGENKDNGEEN